MIPGGWTDQHALTDEDKKVFAIALKGHVGATFEPISVASQVVNGINYIFIAKETTLTLPPTNKLVKLYISAVPAGAEPKLDNIEPIIE